jgi:hypothetical protein
MRPLFVLALIVFAVCSAYEVGRFEQHDRFEQLYNEAWKSDIDVKRFVPGKEYKYFYDGQILNGIPGSSKQHSGTRIQALVTVQIPTEKTLVLMLQNVRMAS